MDALRQLQPDHVCLIKPSSLGDVVHALPVLAALRDRWPSARIVWVVNHSLHDLVDGHPYLDEVIPFDRRRLRSFPRFLRSLHARRFDLAIDLQGLLRSGLMAWATGAPIRVGMGDSREGARWFHTHVVPTPAGKPHAVDRLMAVAAELGCDPTPRFVPNLSEDDRAWAEERLGGFPRPIIAYNLGARWLTKRWPPEHFAAVARSQPGTVVAVGAPEDRALVDRFRLALGDRPVWDLSGRTTLRQLAAVAQTCDLFVSNDTGPLHLAAATGTPVVGIYTCTSPAKTGPYGPDAHVVATEVWCAASLRKTCDRMECMGELTPERVIRVVERALTTGRPPGGRFYRPHSGRTSMPSRFETP